MLRKASAAHADPVRRPTWTEEDDTDDEFPELLD